MRALIQRVSRAEVRAEGRTVGRIGRGLLIFVGFTHTDAEAQVGWMAEKVANIRLFPDEEDRLNRSLADVQGSALVVSQFTLYADAERGRRPSFVDAARPDAATPLYDRFVTLLRERGIPTETGTFGAAMEVDLTNDGPVTLWLER